MSESYQFVNQQAAPQPGNDQQNPVHFGNHTPIAIIQSGPPESFFDGSLAQLIGYRILSVYMILFTLGICLPWAVCLSYRWETKHTVINGRRLFFSGTASQLFGKWIKWWLLSLITLGIYGLWASINLKKWQVKHTHFM